MEWKDLRAKMAPQVLKDYRELMGDLDLMGPRGTRESLENVTA